MADFQRFMSVERDINSIKPDDKKVAVAGVIISKDKESFMLDDGSGTIRVVSDIKVDVKKVVRVLGLVQMSSDGQELRTDIVQDFSGVDMDLYKTARKLWNEV